MELNHGGRTTHPAVSGHQPVAPSPVPCRVTGGGLPQQPAAADIRRLVRAYGDAARRCRQAGVDVLTVHGGHGYLIHQSLSPVTNHRGVRIVLGAEVTALEEQRLRVRTAGGEEWIDAPGPLLVSQGVVPDTRLLDACLCRGPRLGVYPVGAADGAGDSLRQCFASVEQAVRALRSRL